MTQKVLSFAEYQALAERTSRQRGAVYSADPERTSAAFKDGARDRLLNGLLGLSGESGELLDLLKKHLFHDHPLDREKARRELGDVLWYASEVASALDMDLGLVAAANIQKLRDRYPDGFDVERSKHRGEQLPLIAKDDKEIK
jgi:NTP pyrophosphatase (non-canonical NTP hydrolase)